MKAADRTSTAWHWVLLLPLVCFVLLLGRELSATPHAPVPPASTPEHLSAADSRTTAWPLAGLAASQAPSPHKSLRHKSRRHIQSEDGHAPLSCVVRPQIALRPIAVARVLDSTVWIPYGSFRDLPARAPPVFPPVL